MAASAAVVCILVVALAHLSQSTVAVVNRPFVRSGRTQRAYDHGLHQFTDAGIYQEGHPTFAKPTNLPHEVLPTEPAAHPVFLQPTSIIRLSAETRAFLNGNNPSQARRRQIMAELVKMTPTSRGVRPNDPVFIALSALLPMGSLVMIKQFGATSHTHLFRAGKPLGRGSFGAVLELTDRITGVKYAMKIMYREISIAREIFVAQEKLREEFELDTRSMKAFHDMNIPPHELVENFHAAVPLFSGTLHLPERQEVVVRGNVVFTLKSL